MPRKADTHIQNTAPGPPKKMAVATDLGVYTDYTIEHLKGLDVLLLEANHDVHMLEAGPYPYYLKRRIMGNKGHLSNEDSAKYFLKAHGEKTKACYLAHLSDDCNTPELALKTYYEVANKLGVDIHDIELIPTKQNEVVFGGEGW